VVIATARGICGPKTSHDPPSGAVGFAVGVDGWLSASGYPEHRTKRHKTSYAPTGWSHARLLETGALSDRRTKYVKDVV